MEQNPWWFLPVLISGSMAAGVVAWNSLTAPRSEEVSPEAIAAQARARALAERASFQQAQSPIIYAIPVMVGLGAFFLWKSRQGSEE